MRIPRRGLLAVSAAATAGTASAQPGFPSRPLRLVVAWAPTGAIDTIARRLAQKLTEALGQTVFVENRSGASGSIGAAEVARAVPDGHTLLALDSTYGMMPFLVNGLPFNHAEAFRLITISAFTPVVAAVRRDAPYATLRDLTEAARRRPEALTYGSGGVGSSVQFATVAYELAAGVRLLHVPYRGGGEAVSALMAGQVDTVFASPSAAMMGGSAAVLRPLAISGPGRLAALPEVPTFAEAGLPDYAIMHWSGLAVPRATPMPIVERLHAEAAKALATPDMVAFLASIASLPGGMPPAEAERLLAEDTQRWRQVVALAGIRPQ
ncbi:Bug family tripartite tricarboxylate transporter substrate binding protein [Plastoroseomonas hellenica]|uniref:Bug family tripartite tricarboxylate transporter substrate binding protein n=1 Tax=Plastoroseomonas hellenica TaxID=2687306 RepID=UPI001BAB9F44|nr:tripartite tricarboxylate transporter substrate-binding protein [Plastoroseomonas hellenica]MBR0643094.1 tripartite tricarboxylate transporter substrate binding protein [Plastoroseomonas hellenica]